MLHHILRPTIWGGLLGLFLGGCALDPVQVPALPQEPRLVAYAVVIPTPDDEASAELAVYVSRSRDLTEPATWDFNVGDTLYADDNVAFINGFPELFLFDVVPGARVALRKDGQLVRQFNEPSDPFTPVIFFDVVEAPTSGSTYEVSVEAPGYPTITARQSVPATVSPQSMALIPDNVPDPDPEMLGFSYSRLSITFADPPGQRNYYRVQVARLDTLPNQQVRLSPVRPRRLSASVTGDDFTDDTLFDGQTFTWQLGLFNNEDGTPPTGRYIVYFNTVSEDYFAFSRSLDIIDGTAQQQFAEPTDLFHNFEGGYGVFYISGRATVRELEF